MNGLPLSNVFGYFITTDFFNPRKKTSAMATSMLDYCKLILEKVSFDRKLFEKELVKAVGILIPTDREELKGWVVRNFGVQYQRYFTDYTPAL